MRRIGAARLKNAIVLEGVQDHGNVGTVIRTANAFGVDAVILTGVCADLYNPKTVRATMGAIFRQRVLEPPLAKRARRWMKRPAAVRRGAERDGAGFQGDTAG